MARGKRLTRSSARYSDPMLCAPRPSDRTGDGGRRRCCSSPLPPPRPLPFCRAGCCDACRRPIANARVSASLHGLPYCELRKFNLVLRKFQAGAGVLVEQHGFSTPPPAILLQNAPKRSEEHTSELQSLMRISYAVFCLKKK